MKTLILNGSPRKNGDTASLISIITQNIEGNYRIVDAYRCNISPCLDCRYCRQNDGCIIKDAMQEIYEYIQECDNILIASPLYFSELTGKLLDVGSRLQTYFCSRYFRGEDPIKKPKKGAVILVGGGDGGILRRRWAALGDVYEESGCRRLRHEVFARALPRDAVFVHGFSGSRRFPILRPRQKCAALRDFAKNRA